MVLLPFDAGSVTELSVAAPTRWQSMSYRRLYKHGLPGTEHSGMDCLPSLALPADESSQLSPIGPGRTPVVAVLLPCWLTATPPFRSGRGLIRAVCKSVLNVGDRTDKSDALYTMSPMSRLPNQISSERADLLVQIARCRRLAKEVTDPETVRQLLALAVEYEQKLAPPTISDCRCWKRPSV